MKKSFLLYQDQREVFESLPEAECKQLILAIFEVANGGQPRNLPPMVSIALIPFKGQIARDREKYHAICQRNKANIEKRWNTRNTSGKSGIRVYTKNTDNDNDDDNENDKENNINTPPTSGDVESLLKGKQEISHEFQYLGLEIAEKMAAPEDKKAECIRLAKYYPDYCYKAMSEVKVSTNPRSKWKLFLWHVNRLIKTNGNAQGVRKQD